MELDVTLIQVRCLASFKVKLQSMGFVTDFLQILYTALARLTVSEKRTRNAYIFPP